jgi:group I intron endonuclease
MGVIYIIKSPSGKNYIGQTNSTADKRWREHIYDAFDEKKDHCKLLNRSIRKYGQDTFKIEVILECADSEMNMYEEKFILEYGTLKPNGLNLKPGGSSSPHLEETKEKISTALKGCKVSVERRTKLSQTSKQNKDLPMYLLELKTNGEVVGYRVCNHPKGPERRFKDMTKTLDEKLQLAKDYLDWLDAQSVIIPTQPKNGVLYIQKYKNGFCVKKPGTIKKYFVSNKLSTEENHQKALEFLQSLDTVQRA